MAKPQELINALVKKLSNSGYGHAAKATAVAKGIADSAGSEIMAIAEPGAGVALGDKASKSQIKEKTTDYASDMIIGLTLAQLKETVLTPITTKIEIDTTDGLWKKIKASFKSEFHDFAVMFSTDVKPELLEFLSVNRDLALQIVVDIARDLAGKSGKDKFKEAGLRIGKSLLQNAGGLTIPNHWIGLLIEVVVAIAKAQGAIK